MAKLPAKHLDYRTTLAPSSLAKQLARFLSIIRTNTKSLGEEPEYLDRAIPMWIREQGQSCSTVLAFYGENPVGVVNFRWLGTDRADVALEGLRILPEHRGQGLTTILVNTFLDHPSTRACEPFVIRDIVATDNEGANAVARANGMIPTASFQTLEHGVVARTSPLVTAVRPLPKLEAQSSLDTVRSVLSNQSDGVLGLFDWRPKPITTELLLSAASESRLIGVVTDHGYDALAIIAESPCLIRREGTQISCIAARTEQSAHELAIYLEGRLALHTKARSVIAHPATGSLMAAVLFARGWRPNRWYQDVVYERRIDGKIRNDPKHQRGSA